MLERLKINENIKAKQDFPGKLYEAILLLVVYINITQVTKGSEEEITLLKVREKISKIDKESKELNK